MTLKETLWPSGKSESAEVAEVKAGLADLSSKFNTLLEYLTAPKAEIRTVKQDAPAVKVNKTVKSGKEWGEDVILGQGKPWQFTVRDPNRPAGPGARVAAYRVTHVKNNDMKLTNLDCFKLVNSAKEAGYKAAQDGKAAKRSPGRPSQSSEIAALLKQNAELIALLKAKA